MRMTNKMNQIFFMKVTNKSEVKIVIITSFMYL